LLPANRLGSEDSVVRAVARRGSTRRFATLHSACSPAALPSWSRVEDVQELAADAHHCIMVRASGPTAYKDVARMFVRHTRAPLDLVIHPDRPSVPSCSEPSRTKPHGGATRHP